MVKVAEKGKKDHKPSSFEEGEEVEVPPDFETLETIPRHMKRLYRQYESMKAHNEEMKDLVEFKTSLGYPATCRKGQIEPRTKAREDKATTQARVACMEVEDVVKTKKMMTSIGLSQVRTRLQDLKGEGPKRKMVEETTPQQVERPIKKTKTQAQ